MKRNVIEVGQKFGNWTVIGLLPHQKANVRVRCECGTEQDNYSSSLASGKSTRCRSCRGRENTGNAKRRITGTHLAAKDKYHDYKVKAKKRGYFWNLTFDEFLEITAKNCIYCNQPPSNVNKLPNKDWADDFVYTGIDRFDNTRGYESDNVLPCCATCNYMKRDLTHLEFISQIAKILKKFNEGGSVFVAEPMLANAEIVQPFVIGVTKLA